MAAQSPVSEGELQKLWDETFNRLYSISGVTVQRNVELEARVAELEAELAVWKRAHSTTIAVVRHENDILQQRLDHLQASLDDNSFVFCVIDGDNLVFADELLRQGLVGGRQAAQQLTKIVAEHLSQDKAIELKGRLSFWVHIYLSKQELEDMLTSQDICTSRELHSFLAGFSHSSPRFSIVDVGCGGSTKSKIQEYLRSYIHLPQTLRLFFGGHEEGYEKTLASIQGTYRKMVFIDTTAIWSLDPMPPAPARVRSSDLFRPRDSDLSRQKFNFGPEAQQRALESSPTLTNLSQNSSQMSYNTAPTGVRVVDPTLPLNKQNPPPCNEFYLMDSCSNGPSCKYSHDYSLTSEQLATLSINAKKAPCNYLKTGVECPFGDQCCWGHSCPNGSKCFHLSKGKCWFKGEAMHDSSSC